MINQRDYIGCPEQLMGIREGRLSGGKAEGVRFVELEQRFGVESDTAA